MATNIKKSNLGKVENTKNVSKTYKAFLNNIGKGKILDMKAVLK